MNRIAPGLPQDSHAPPRPPTEIASLILQIDKHNAKQVTFFKEVLTPRLLRAGLSLSAWDGVVKVGGGQSIFVEVFASLPRLLAEAERAEFNFLLSSTALRSDDVSLNRDLAVEGIAFAPPGSSSTEPDLAIPSRTAWMQTTYDPYEYIFSRYAPAASHLYATSASTGTVVTETAGLKLLKLIIEGPESGGGGGLELAHLLHQR